MSDIEKKYMDLHRSAEQCLGDVVTQMKGASSLVMVRALERGLQEQQEEYSPNDPRNPMNNA